MSRGKRYDDEQKLNLKKVLAVILVIIVIILFFVGIKNMLKREDDIANSFSEISYFTVNNNGKWGVINSKGDIIIEANNEEMIAIPNSKKDVFVYNYDVNYTDGSYKTKAVNASNDQLFSSYEKVEILSNYDENNNIWYESNCLKVQKDGKYGLIDLNGNEILSPIYDSVETMKGIENSIIIKKDNLCGVSSTSGNIIVEPKYKEVLALTKDYSNGYIVKDENGNCGVIKIDKSQALDCKYSDIKHIYGADTYVVKASNKWKFVKNNEDEGTELSYSDVTAICDENFVVANNGKYGIVDDKLTEKVSLEYSSLEHAFLDYYIAGKDSKYGVINSNGEVLVEIEYESLKYNKDADCLVAKKPLDDNTYLLDRNLEAKVACKSFTVEKGYIRANIEDQYKFYNLKLEEKNNREVYPNNTLYVAKNDGKFGLVNRDGTLVVPYQYEDITEQNEYGYVAVKKDGKWGVIDQYGNNVVDPCYELSDISKVCVVGKWHTAENVNTTYFVCE